MFRKLSHIKSYINNPETVIHCTFATGAIRLELNDFVFTFMCLFVRSFTAFICGNVGLRFKYSKNISVLPVTNSNDLKLNVCLSFVFLTGKTYSTQLSCRSMVRAWH